MRLKRNFDPAEPTTARWYYLDFGPQLATGETLRSATAALFVVQGTDPSPSAHIQGSAAILGTEAGAFITGLLPGVTYSVEVTVLTSLGNTLVNNARVRCQAPADR